MRDTGATVQKRWRELMLSKSGAERLAMGCDMFDDAKRIVLAGLRAQNPGKTDAEIKPLLFLRLYGQGFSLKKKDQIQAALRRI